MGTMRMFFGLFIIAAAFYIAAKLAPPYFNNYEFTDAVKDEATRDSYSQKNEGEIRKAIFKKAQEYDIPLSEDEIVVQRSGLQFNGTIVVRAPYVVHVDLPGYPLDLHFDASTENKGVF
ncbi:MAG TPA: hypothetical protein VL349_02725 [Terriglobales bacterium]|jgi:hypothetical protein|nr:hypothetical protein [Terriglobales bacterium]